MAQADQLARLLVFLLLGYFALTAAATFAFTFVWVAVETRGKRRRRRAIARWAYQSIQLSPLQ
jgi:hypothetical protein